MPRDNVEIARKYFAAWSDPSFQPELDEVDPAVQIDWSESNAPYAGVYSGHDGWRRLFDEIRDSFEDTSVDAHDYISAGPHVAVPNTLHLRGRGGIEVVARSTIVFTFRNGMLAAARLYQRDADALAAIGADSG